MEELFRQLIEAVGEDCEREGLRDTPRRVARMYQEIAGGFEDDAIEVLQTQFEQDQQEMVIMRDLPFYSLCEHHLLPFFGTAHVGYIPRGKIVGLGFGDDDESTRMRAFFDRGNALTLRQLQRYFASSADGEK